MKELHLCACVLGGREGGINLELYKTITVARSLHTSLKPSLAGQPHSPLDMGNISVILSYRDT